MKLSNVRNIYLCLLPRWGMVGSVLRAAPYVCPRKQVISL